jgi:hypothetical protein
MSNTAVDFPRHIENLSSVLKAASKKPTRSKETMPAAQMKVSTASKSFMLEIIDQG